MRLLGHHPRTLCGIASALGTRGNAIECPWVEGSYRGEAVYRFLLRPAYSILEQLEQLEKLEELEELEEQEQETRTRTRTSPL